MDWLKTIAKVAPTVATALGGPLAGAAVSAIGGILGQDDPTPQSVAQAIESGQLTPEHIAEIRKLELQYQENEKERGFRYAELSFKDRDSARQANVAGGVQVKIFWLSIWLIATCLGAELVVLWTGLPHGLPEVVVGRILGLLDGLAIQVTNYWFGTTNGSALKTELLAKAEPVK